MPAKDNEPGNAKTENSDGSVYGTTGNESSNFRGEPVAKSTGGPQKSPPSRDDLRGAESSSPSSGDSNGAGADSARPELKDAEDDGSPGFRYRQSRDGRMWQIGRHRRLIWGGVGGLGVILAVLVLVSLFLPNLKIPQLAAEIESYRLARLARTFSQNASTLMADKTMIDASADTTTADLIGKTPFGKALSLYKPGKVISNLKATNVMELNYSPAAGGTQKLDNIKFNFSDGTSTEVKPPQFKFSLNPADIKNNYLERLRFASEMSAALKQTPLSDANILIRSNVGEALRKAAGVNLTWLEKGALSLFGKNQQADDVLLAQRTEQRIARIPSDDFRTSTLKDEAAKVQQAYTTCFENTSCTEDALAHNGIPTTVKNLIASMKISPSEALSIASPIYAAAFPVCIAYDGSTQTASTLINAQSTAALRLFLSTATEADQIKNGDASGAAIGAGSRQAGDVYDSIPSQLNRGAANVSTSGQVSAEAGRSGEYSIFNAFDSLFGGNGNSTGARVANTIAYRVCPAITNVWTGIGLTIGSVVAPFVSGLSSVGADGLSGAAEGTAQGLISTIGEKIASKISGRVVYDAVRNTAVQVGTSDALTTVARMFVFSQAGAFINGLDPSIYPQLADMGATVYGNMMMQQETFGRPLTPSETQAVETQDSSYRIGQIQQQSTYTRLFALSNPNSMLGRFAMAASSWRFSQLPGKLGQMLFSNIFSKIGSLFSAHSLAASQPANTDYGLVQFGWSPDEENLIKNDPSYDPVVNDQILNDKASGNYDRVWGPKGIAAYYAPCFGYSYDSQNQALQPDSNVQIGDLLGGTNPPIVRDSSGNVIANQGKCAPENLTYTTPVDPSAPSSTDSSPLSSKGSDLVFRWRLEESYQHTLTELSGIQDPSTSLPTSGSGQSGSASTSPSSSGTYQNPFRGINNLVPQRIDMGVDYDGSGPIYALGNGTVDYIFLNWCTPDQGGCVKNEPLLAYTLSDGPAAGKTVYVAECITPEVQPGQAVTSNSVIAQMSNCGNGIETGWGTSAESGGLTMANPSAQNNCFDGTHSTAFGQNFSDLIKSLGGTPGNLVAPASCALPQGWPSW